MSDRIGWWCTFALNHQVPNSIQIHIIRTHSCFHLIECEDHVKADGESLPTNI
jgi:hypothetical protein